YGEDWPIAYADLEPYYDKVDLYLGISGVKENLPHLPDSQFQRPSKLNWGEVKLRESLKKAGQVLTPYRAGVTTDGLKHNKYRSKCYGRGACDRRPGGCDIHAVFDSPTGLIYPAMDTGHLTVRPNSTAHEVLVDKNTGRARGVAFLDSVTHKSYEAKGKVVILAASTLESARLLLLSRSPQHPNGLGNSSGHVGHNFCEHVMGPGVTGLIKELVGKPDTVDEGRLGDPGAALPLSLLGQRAQDGRGHGRDGPRNARGGGDRGCGDGRESAHGGVVDPRAGHGAHGQRSQDLGAEPVSAVARRPEPVCRRRLEPRQRVVSESHVDHHGAGVALV